MHTSTSSSFDFFMFFFYYFFGQYGRIDKKKNFNWFDKVQTRCEPIAKPSWFPFLFFFFIFIPTFVLDTFALFILNICFFFLLFFQLLTLNKWNMAYLKCCSNKTSNYRFCLIFIISVFFLLYVFCTWKHLKKKKLNELNKMIIKRNVF